MTRNSYSALGWLWENRESNLQHIQDLNQLKSLKKKTAERDNWLWSQKQPCAWSVKRTEILVIATHWRSVKVYSLKPKALSTTKKTYSFPHSAALDFISSSSLFYPHKQWQAQKDCDCRKESEQLLTCKAGGRENRNLPDLHNNRPIDRVQ